MEQTKTTKAFILEYLGALKTLPITKEALASYISDPSLIDHILFFNSIFPGYEVIADEMVADGNRVILRARMRGKHLGEFNGIPPTYREVEFPFAIGYEIDNNKIVSHWLIADQLSLLEQLGVSAAATAH